MPQAAQGLDRAGDRDVVASDRVDQLGPADIARPGVGAGEIVPGRPLRREGVGLVLKTADRYTHWHFRRTFPKEHKKIWRKVEHVEAATRL